MSKPGRAETVDKDESDRLVYTSSNARRFVVELDADGVTADSLYVVLCGNKTLGELKGAIKEALGEALGCPSLRVRFKGLWHVVGGRPSFLCSQLNNATILDVFPPLHYTNLKAKLEITPQPKQQQQQLPGVAPPGMQPQAAASGAGTRRSPTAGDKRGRSPTQQHQSTGAAQQVGKPPHAPTSQAKQQPGSKAASRPHAPKASPGAKGEPFGATPKPKRRKLEQQVEQQKEQQHSPQGIAMPRGVATTVARSQVVSTATPARAAAAKATSTTAAIAAAGVAGAKPVVAALATAAAAGAVAVRAGPIAGSVDEAPQHKKKRRRRSRTQGPVLSGGTAAEGRASLDEGMAAAGAASTKTGDGPATTTGEATETKARANVDGGTTAPVLTRAERNHQRRLQQRQQTAEQQQQVGEEQDEKQLKHMATQKHKEQERAKQEQRSQEQKQDEQQKQLGAGPSQQQQQQPAKQQQQQQTQKGGRKDAVAHAVSPVPPSEPGVPSSRRARWRQKSQRPAPPQNGIEEVVQHLVAAVTSDSKPVSPSEATNRPWPAAQGNGVAEVQSPAPTALPGAAAGSGARGSAERTKASLAASHGAAARLLHLRHAELKRKRLDLFPVPEVWEGSGGAPPPFAPSPPAAGQAVKRQNTQAGARAPKAGEVADAQPGAAGSPAPARPRAKEKAMVQENGASADMKKGSGGGSASAQTSSSDSSRKDGSSDDSASSDGSGDTSGSGDSSKGGPDGRSSGCASEGGDGSDSKASSGDDEEQVQPAGAAGARADPGRDAAPGRSQQAPAGQDSVVNDSGSGSSDEEEEGGSDTSSDSGTSASDSATSSGSSSEEEEERDHKDSTSRGHVDGSSGQVLLTTKEQPGSNAQGAPLQARPATHMQTVAGGAQDGFWGSGVTGDGTGTGSRGGAVPLASMHGAQSAKNGVAAALALDGTNGPVAAGLAAAPGPPQGVAPDTAGHAAVPTSSGRHGMSGCPVGGTVPAGSGGSRGNSGGSDASNGSSSSDSSTSNDSKSSDDGSGEGAGGDAGEQQAAAHAAATPMPAKRDAPTASPAGSDASGPGSTSQSADDSGSSGDDSGSSGDDNGSSGDDSSSSGDGDDGNAQAAGAPGAPALSEGGVLTNEVQEDRPRSASSSPSSSSTSSSSSSDSQSSSDSDSGSEEQGKDEGEQEGASRGGSQRRVANSGQAATQATGAQRARDEHGAIPAGSGDGQSSSSSSSGDSSGSGGDSSSDDESSSGSGNNSSSGSEANKEDGGSSGPSGDEQDADQAVIGAAVPDFKGLLGRMWQGARGKSLAELQEQHERWDNHPQEQQRADGGTASGNPAGGGHEERSAAATGAAAASESAASSTPYVPGRGLRLAPVVFFSSSLPGLRSVTRELIVRYQAAVPPPKKAAKMAGAHGAKHNSGNGGGESEAATAAVRRRALAERHAALMGDAASQKAAEATKKLMSRLGEELPEDDAVVHVNWSSRRVDWDAEARPLWLPPELTWGADLLGSKRTSVEAVYSRVKSALEELVREDAAELGRGGLEVPTGKV